MTTWHSPRSSPRTVKPLYAVAGATEVAYEFARGYTLEAQKTAAERLSDVQTRVSKIEREPKALQNQAVSRGQRRVAELQKDAKDAQGEVRSPPGPSCRRRRVRFPRRSRTRSTTPSPSSPRPTPTSSTVARRSSPPSARTASRRSARCARLRTSLRSCVARRPRSRLTSRRTAAVP